MNGERLRELTGSVKSGNPLTEFLYALMRDHVPAGVVQEIVQGLGSTSRDEEPGNAIVYSNGYLARLAKLYAAELMQADTSLLAAGWIVTVRRMLPRQGTVPDVEERYLVAMATRAITSSQAGLESLAGICQQTTPTPAEATRFASSEHAELVAAMVGGVAEPFTLVQARLATRGPVVPPEDSPGDDGAPDPALRLCLSCKGMFTPQDMHNERLCLECHNAMPR